MKSSNTKSKMRRFTYSACALLLAGGFFTSCDDELLTGTPSWLGSSIYEELQRRGEFETTLRLINDPEVSVLNADGQTEYAKLLKLTGSKTLFVARDEAYNRFFQNNRWGVRRYEDLTAAQKKLLFNSAMVNSAYLIELMSSTAGAGDDGMPNKGACLRRASAVTIYDSIPAIKYDQITNENEFWTEFKTLWDDAFQSEDATGDKGDYLIMRDNHASPMVHFLPAYMQAINMTSDDLKFITNGSCTDLSQSYVNGQRVVEQDITCQNGYLHVIENVMEPLTNMAEEIAGDPELSVFSSFLERFSVPAASEATITTDKGNRTYAIWRYLNDGFGLESGYNTLTTVNGKKRDDVGFLPFDPGWNTLYNTTMGGAIAGDMAAIIAPTNEAFVKFFSEGAGANIATRYGVNVGDLSTVKNIPNTIVLNIMDNLMRESMANTLPSKFGTVMNTSLKPMNLSAADIKECIMANNGVIYKSNKVYTIPEYQSVSFPTQLDDRLLIMRYMINYFNYQAYLNSMDSEYMFVVPTDEALKNYIDPVDFCKSQKTITEFYYDDSPAAASFRVKARRYKMTFDEATGTYTRGDEINDPYKNGSTEQDYVVNRLRDILDNSIIVKDPNGSPIAENKMYLTKNNAPIVVRGEGAQTTFVSPFWTQYGSDHSFGVGEDDGGNPYYTNFGHNPDGNGETFVIDDEPVMGATYSVLTRLKQLQAAGNRDYDEFINLLRSSDLLQQFYDITKGSSTDGTRTAKTVTNDTTINVMENYNYTIYVPKSDEIRKLYNNDILPSPAKVEEVYAEIEKAENREGDYGQMADGQLQEEIERLEAKADALIQEINNFLKYHIQNRAVYAGGTPVSGVSYDTALMLNGRFATLEVTSTGAENNGISIVCKNSSNATIAGAEPRRVLSGNCMAREYRFRTAVSANDTKEDSKQPRCTDIEKATRIYNSSTAVIHLIDKPLVYSQEMSDKYNAAN